MTDRGEGIHPGALDSQPPPVRSCPELLSDRGIIVSLLVSVCSDGR